MSREKQIEEMARDICHLTVSCEECTMLASKTNQTKEQYCKAMTYAKRAYAKCYRKQEWISVIDELPETYTDVLYFDGQSIGVDFICSDGTWCDEEVRSNKVTHWMPLPEAPKMKGDSDAR